MGAKRMYTAPTALERPNGGQGAVPIFQREKKNKLFHGHGGDPGEEAVAPPFLSPSGRLGEPMGRRHLWDPARIEMFGV